MTVAVAVALVHLGRGLRDGGISARLARAGGLIVLGVMLAAGAATVDAHLHRGVESGGEVPYVVLPTSREQAVNVDLTLVASEQLPSVASALRSNGFRYVRQPFAWSAIEPRRGAFDWERADAIVAALRTHGLTIVAVLQSSPDWARLPETRGYPDAPPADVADFARFVDAFGRRYGRQIDFVQIWDLPNRIDRWGGVIVRPEEYVALLAEAHNAVVTANPFAKVVLAELDPRGATGMVGADLEFLRALYDANVSPYFDIAAVRLDGGKRSPHDRRVDPGVEGISRAIRFRRLMVERGDADRPLWATHYGWRAGEEGMTRERQAAYMVDGIRRARAEWPWMGLMFAWDLFPRDDSEGYALLDGVNATPAFTALADLARETAALAPTGFVPMDSPAVGFEGNWADQHLNRRTYRTTREIGATAVLRFEGTGVIAYLRFSPESGLVYATLDGKPVPGWPREGDVSKIDLKSLLRAEDFYVSLVSGLDEGAHELRLTLASEGQLTIGGMVVTRDLSMTWPIVALAITAAGAIFLGLRELAYAVALWTGYLREERGGDLRSALPWMADWRPVRRA